MNVTTFARRQRMGAWLLMAEGFTVLIMALILLVIVGLDAVPAIGLFVVFALGMFELARRMFRACSILEFKGEALRSLGASLHVRFR